MASEYLKWKYRDVKPDEPPPPPTGWDKVKNWFSYNWYWLAAGAVILAILGGILWTALGIGKTRPDYILAYVGRGELPEQTREALIAAVQRLGIDVNGDGEIYVELHSYATAETSDGYDDYEMSQYNMGVNVRLSGDISAGESVFFLMDDPDAFQRGFQILANPDGTAPEEGDLGWEGRAIPVEDLPALGLEDGSGLYLGRRFYVRDNRKTDRDADDALWQAILKGAVTE